MMVVCITAVYSSLLQGQNVQYSEPFFCSLSQNPDDARGMQSVGPVTAHVTSRDTHCAWWCRGWESVYSITLFRFTFSNVDAEMNFFRGVCLSLSFVDTVGLQNVICLGALA